MSLFSKLAFWKKEEDFNFDQAIAQDMNQPSAFPPDFSAQDNPFPGDSELNPAPTQTPSASPQQYAQASRASLYPGSSVPIANPSSGGRDLDLINSKLDTIRAMLASIEQRLDKLEKTEQKQPGRLW